MKGHRRRVVVASAEKGFVPNAIDKEGVDRLAFGILHEKALIAQHPVGDSRVVSLGVVVLHGVLDLALHPRLERPFASLGRSGQVDGLLPLACVAVEPHRPGNGFAVALATDHRDRGPA